MSCHAFPKRPPWHNPMACKEHMPFAGHRNCAQWGHSAKYHHKLSKEMTDEERERDAVNGSAKLRDAIKRAAA